MKKYPLATIVNFCTNERRFVKECLEQAQIFSKQVIVPVCDHFFDGTPENRELLDSIYAAFPNCHFIEYPYIPNKIPKRVWKTLPPSHFWHSLSRLIGFTRVGEEIDSVLFLDADEIADGRRFAEWLDVSDYQCHMALRLANYWYFRESKYQALKWEDSVVLAQRRAVEPELILSKEERDSIYDSLPHPKRRHVIGVNGEPMFHHYSWVRSEEEMLKKVGAWGHRNDRNWAELVKKEFSGPFQGTDFIHGYSYKTVEPIFRVDAPIFEKKGSPFLEKIAPKEILQLIDCKKSPFWTWVTQTFWSK